MNWKDVFQVLVPVAAGGALGFLAAWLMNWLELRRNRKSLCFLIRKELEHNKKRIEDLIHASETDPHPLKEFNVAINEMIFDTYECYYDRLYILPCGILECILNTYRLMGEFVETRKDITHFDEMANKGGEIGKMGLLKELELVNSYLENDIIQLSESIASTINKIKAGDWVTRWFNPNELQLISLFDDHDDSC